jgi:citrate synthase
MARQLRKSLNTVNYADSQLANLNGKQIEALKEIFSTLNNSSRLKQAQIEAFYKEENEDKSLKDQKTEKEIELLNRRIEQIDKEYIKRIDHEAILSSRASSLRNFLESTFQQNLYKIATRPIAELPAIAHQFVKQLMDAWSGNV